MCPNVAMDADQRRPVLGTIEAHTLAAPAPPPSVARMGRAGGGPLPGRVERPRPVPYATKLAMIMPLAPPAVT